MFKHPLRSLFANKLHFYFLLSNLISFFHLLIFLTSLSPFQTTKLTACFLLFAILLLHSLLIYKSNILQPHKDLKTLLFLFPSLIIHSYVLFIIFENNDSSIIALNSILILYYSSKSLQNLALKSILILIFFTVFCWKFKLFANSLLHAFSFLILLILLISKKIIMNEKIDKNRNSTKITKYEIDKSINCSSEEVRQFSKFPEMPLNNIMDSLQEVIVRFDCNLKLKWVDSYIYKLIERSSDISKEELENIIFSFTLDEKYQKMQNLGIKSEMEFSNFFKAFKTKIALFNGTFHDIPEDLNSSGLISKKTFSSTKRKLRNSLMNYKTPTSELKTIRNQQKSTHFLNKNADFRIKPFEIQKKTFKNLIEEYFLSVDKEKMIDFSLYGRSELLPNCKRYFLINFLPIEDDVLIILKPLGKNDLFLTACDNYLSQNRMLASMCHELRTPLNSITNMLELLEYDHLNDSGISRDTQHLSTNDYISNALLNSKLLLSSINDFLDYFSLSSNIFELEPTEFNLKKLIQECFTLFQTISSKKDLEFRLEYDRNLPAKCVNDERRVKQILMNLLNNAFKFTEHGSVVLKVKPRSNFFEIIVKDTGMGIERSHLKLLANFQMPKSPTQTLGGFGLCITNHLVNHVNNLGVDEEGFKIYKGLKVKTETDKGSQFSFLLEKNINEIKENLNLEVGESVSETRKRTALDGFNENHRKKFHFFSERKFATDKEEMQKDCQCPKVLAVDDNAFNLFVLQEKFKKIGHQIDVASSGDEAIEKIRALLQDAKGKFCEKCQFYRVILMDIDMPGKNGYETTEELKRILEKEGKNVPIVALSAFSQIEAKGKATKAGMLGFLEKPFTQEKMEYIVSNYFIS